MNKGLFVPTETNLGGKTAIKKQLFNHHAALLNIRPTMNTQIPPRPHVSAYSKKRNNISQKYKSGEFNEVYHTFKKVVQTTRPYIDDKKPKSFGVISKSQPKHKREKDFINQEHNLHLKSQLRRIASIGTQMHERKKNLFDPIAYPSIIFKKTSPKKSPDNFMFSQASITRHTAKPIVLHSLQKKAMQRPKTATKQENQSIELQNQYNENPSTDVELPYLVGDSENDLKEFKQKIIDIIMEKQIYKDADLKKLFKSIAQLNTHIEEDKLTAVFNEIDEEF